MNKDRASNKDLARKMDFVAIGFSIVVFILVGLMRTVRLDFAMDTSWMPAFNALCNSIVALCLVAALIFIKRKEVTKHQIAIYIAMFFSFLFLLSYVVYHFSTEEVSYCKEGGRLAYYVVLISHIILAGLSLPFILFTFIRGYTRQIDRHRRLARWVFPVWLYVAVTGPICFLMLKDCY